jgi:hypothetical protein
VTLAHQQVLTIFIETGERKGEESTRRRNKIVCNKGKQRGI